MKTIIIDDRCYEVDGLVVHERIGPHHDDVRLCAPALSAAVRCAVAWRDKAAEQVESP